MMMGLLSSRSQSLEKVNTLLRTLAAVILALLLLIHLGRCYDQRIARSIQESPRWGRTLYILPQGPSSVLATVHCRCT